MTENMDYLIHTDIVCFEGQLFRTFARLVSSDGYPALES